METMAVFVCLASYILSINLLILAPLLARCFRLHPMMKLKWNLSECVSVCLCTRDCVKVREERERRSEPKCNLSLNRTASPGEKAPLPGVSQ